MTQQSSMVESYDDLDLFGGTDTEEASASFFINGQSFDYVRGIWMSGYKVTYMKNGKPAGKARGLWYEVARMPEEFMVAIEKLEKQKDDNGDLVAIRADIRHGDGTVKAYVSIPKAEYYVLAHGTPSRKSILEDPLMRQRGLACGTWTKYNPKTQTTDKSTFVSVLAVCKQLHNAGYYEKDGTPKPVNIHIKGITSDEFYKALTAHSNNVIAQLRKIGYKPNDVQYWGFSQPLICSEEEVTHGQGEDSQDVYTIVSGHPAKAECTAEYIASLRAPRDLYVRLFKLVINTDEDAPRTPAGSPVALWCEDMVERGLKNQRDFTGPQGQEIKLGGRKPAPPWLINRDTLKDNQIFAPTSSGEATPAQPQENPLQRLIDRLNGQRTWFTLQIQSEEANDEGDQDADRLASLKQGLIKVTTALKACSNEMQLPVAEVRQQVEAQLEAIGELRASLKR